MSYKPGTILVRKEPFEATEDQDFTPFNEIEIIGNSPVQTGVRQEEWGGQQGDQISIRPTSFGPVVDRPAGELQRDYDIKSIPAPVKFTQQQVEIQEPGPSPEEQFSAVAAKLGGKPKASTRQRTSLESS